jgi:hypothetical protein
VARKERKDAALERLEGLLAAGDWRAARAEVARLAGPGADGTEVEGDRGAVARARARLRPGPTALLAVAGGLAFLAVVAAAGLRMR